MDQLSHLYMTTGKTIALTIWTFVGEVRSMLFNTVSKLVIDFLPRSKLLLILWLLSTSAVFLEPKKIKSVTASTFSPSICYEVIGPDAMSLVFLMWSFKPDFTLLFHPHQESLYFLFTFCHWKWKLVTRLCPTLWKPMDCSLPGSFVHGILQAKLLECVVISFSDFCP